jgi:hypothetical protein
MTEVNDRLEAESTQEQLEDLADEDSDTVNLPNGQTVQVGQIVMFVQNGHRWLDSNMASALAGLTMVDTTELDGLLGEDTLLLNPLEKVVGVLAQMWERLTTIESRVEVLETQNVLLKQRIQTILDESAGEPTADSDGNQDIWGISSNGDVVVVEPSVELDAGTTTATTTESVATSTPEVISEEDTATTTEENVEEPVAIVSDNEDTVIDVVDDMPTETAEDTETTTASQENEENEEADKSQEETQEFAGDELETPDAEDSPE